MNLNKLNKKQLLEIRSTFNDSKQLMNMFTQKTKQTIRIPQSLHRQATVVFHVGVIVITIVHLWDFYNKHRDLDIYTDIEHVRILQNFIQIVVWYNRFTHTIAKAFPMLYMTMYTALLSGGAKVFHKLRKDPSKLKDPLKILNTNNYNDLKQKIATAFISNIGRTYVSPALLPVSTIGNTVVKSLNTIHNILQSEGTIINKARLYRQLQQRTQVGKELRITIDTFLEKSMYAYVTTLLTLLTMSSIRITKVLKR